ncbi:tetraprenyl-beta-curcumene synthase [Conexibacter arvalis]|uniref:Tetraprenyl-beta-curcumene synthase n=2 Tax=Conexibacter arvalis TaxID=912552 RepID=A0A840IFN6_9ACTN|nr:tetraprenyl-beta-curcumene synthase [Conexibacter arvalis]
MAMSALAAYGLSVVPVARRELKRWRRAAASVPDTALRRMALDTLAAERMNAEAATVFATLAPWRQRFAAVRALCAMQVLVDYVDTLSEQLAEHPLQASLTLHAAICDALADQPPSDGTAYYAGFGVGDDGGYLAELMRACARELRRLPSFARVRPVAQLAAARCAAGQSYTHAARSGDRAPFAAWARTLDRGDGLAWWEVAAGASSSVAVHALIAAAADRSTTDRDARLVDAAYYPPIGALTVLFDSLIDRDEDRMTGNHNYMAYYESDEVVAERLAAITRQAQAAVRPLRRRRRNEAIVAGVAGFYLGASDRVEGVALVRERVAPMLGGVVRPIMAVMRARRHLRDRARRADPVGPSAASARR